MPPARATVLLFALALLATSCGPGGTSSSEVAPGPIGESPAGVPMTAAQGESGIATEPFTGPAHNGLIGLGTRGPLGLFSVAGRPTLVAPEDDTEEADQDPPALRWLAAQQAADGGWQEGLEAGAPHSNDARLTGRVLLAFLASGQTNRGRHAFAKVVSRGLRFLKNHQGPYGWYGKRGDGENLHDLTQHAPACAAMVEAYAQTQSPIFKSAATRGLDALAAACAAQDRDLREPEVAYEALLALIAARRTESDFLARDKHPPFRVRAEAYDALARQRTPPGEPPKRTLPSPSSLATRSTTWEPTVPEPSCTHSANG